MRVSEGDVHHGPLQKWNISVVVIILSEPRWFE